METKGKIIMVGALQAVLSDHRSGGQAFACGSLVLGLEASGWHVEKIDSSLKSIKVKMSFGRLSAAVRRMARFTLSCISSRPSAALVFCSSGLSFVEKGVMVGIARFTGIPVILFPRSGHLVKNLRSSAFRAFAGKAIRAADCVVCQSPTWRLKFRDVSGQVENLLIVENWLPQVSFVQSDVPVASSQRGHFVAGYFGRIERDKGIFDFIDSIAVAAQSVPSLRGVVYGDGSAVPEVRDVIERRGLEHLIEWRGWVAPEEKMSTVRELDLFVFTSHFEGFPNAVLEAAAMKVPIVSVRVGAVSDVLIHGVSALLCEVGDVAQIAGAIIEAAGDRKALHSRAEAAYQRVKQKNTVAVALNQVERVLDRLARS